MTIGWEAWGCVTVQPKKQDLVPGGADHRLRSLSPLQMNMSRGGDPFDALPSSKAPLNGLSRLTHLIKLCLLPAYCMHAWYANNNNIIACNFLRTKRAVNYGRRRTYVLQ